jgi:hypothetical protein
MKGERKSALKANAFIPADFVGPDRQRLGTAVLEILIRPQRVRTVDLPRQGLFKKRSPAEFVIHAW